MSDIGGQTFNIVRGLPQALKTRIDVYETPGVDGYEAQTLGQGDSGFELTAIAYVPGGDDEDQTPSDMANALITACNALQGTIISVTDDWGDTYDGLLVHKVDASGPACKLPVVWQGAACVRVEIRFALCST